MKCFVLGYATIHQLHVYFIISLLDKTLGRFFSDFQSSIFTAHLLSLIEQIWELIWKFHFKSIVWRIKIDSLIAQWTKWGLNEKKMLLAHFQLISARLSRFGSSIEKFHIEYSWYIKIDRFHGQSIKRGQKLKNRTTSFLAQVSRFESSFLNLILNIGCDVSK